MDRKEKFTITGFSPTSNLIEAHIKFCQDPEEKTHLHHLLMTQIFFSVVWFEGKIEEMLIKALGISPDYEKMRKICNISSLDEYQACLSEMLNVDFQEVLKKEYEGCKKLFKLRNIFAHGSALLEKRELENWKSESDLKLDPKKNPLDDIYEFFEKRKIIKGKRMGTQGPQLSTHILTKEVANWAWKSVQTWVKKTLTEALDSNLEKQSSL